ncbi:MAG TPA: SGNH/GDSL hydrolase family protein [Ignavibacteriaceae bacterium]|nr:SGNH/GDSL hydrolase family protein [Ignavibacteriaceae bacterium]
MIQEVRKFFTLLNVLIIFVFITGSVYIYRGFYHIDYTIYYLHDGTSYLLKGIKFVFPIVVIALIFLYGLVYLKKIQLSSVILLFISFIFFLLIVYPFADYFYRKSLTENIDEFHSFLQIKPPHVNHIDTTKYNVFCLGGSTTEFKDETGRDWPGLVQEKLNKELLFKDIRLFNLGKQWYSTQHILINYALNLKQYKPDAVIVMENINDLLHNADFSWLSTGEFRDDYGNFLGPLTRLIKYGSFAEFLVKTIDGLWYQEKPIEIETTEFRGLKAFERNLNTLITLAKEDGTKIILMTQPNIYKDQMTEQELGTLGMLNGEAVGNGKRWTYKTALNGFRQYNDKIREIASTKGGVYLIDLELIVPKSLEFFIDDVHYNSKTHDLISLFISEELKKIFKNELVEL